MKVTYTAIDGVYLNAAEDLATLCAEDSVQGGNLLSAPNKIGSWTTANSATLTQENNQEIRLTNGAASTGYMYKAATLVSGTYYLAKMYVNVGDSGGVYIYAYGGTNLATSAVKTTSGVIEIIFKADQSSVNINIRNNVATSDLYSIWSFIEVLELNHYGVDETTEYQTNGTFTTDTTDWTAAGASLAVVSGELEITTAGAEGAYQDISVTAGQVYKLTCTARRGTAAASIYLLAYDGASFTTQIGSDYTNSSSNTALTVYAKPTGSTLRVYLYVGAAAGTAYYDNVVVKKSGNLVANSNFVVNGIWTLGTGWVISGGAATKTAGTASNLSQAISTTVLYTYVVTYTLTLTAGTLTPYLGASGNAGTTRSTVGTYTYSDTIVSATDGGLYFVANSGFAGSVDNVTVRRAYVDLSSNADGLEVHGEPVEVPVNWNSTTVALGKFSNYSYLKQPYNSVLDPGTTSDINMSCWIFPLAEDSGNQGIFARTDSADAQRYYAYIDSSEKINFITDDNNTNQIATSTGTLTVGAWNHIACCYDASTGDTSIYLNGDLDSTTNGAVLNTLSNSSAFLIIGSAISAGTLTSPLDNALIALFKLDVGTLWTAQYVKTVYESELPLTKQNEIYSVNGESLTLGVKLRNSNPGIESSEDYTESMDGVREYIVKWTKGTYDLQTTPVSFDKTNEVRKFLKSVVGQSFTLSERSFEYGADNDVTVYKTSRNEKLTRVGITPDGKGAYSVNFSVRER